MRFKFINIKTFALSALLLGALNGMAQNSKPNLEKIARDFFDAYANKDFDGMASFYHDSVRYLDPTSSAFGASLDLHGKQEFVSAFNKIIGNDCISMKLFNYDT